MISVDVWGGKGVTRVQSIGKREVGGRAKSCASWDPSSGTSESRHLQDY